jgi:hypothetical protein
LLVTQSEDTMIPRRFLLFVLLLSVTITEAQVPRQISYQGLLTTLSGNPLADGAYNLGFDLYDSLAGGTMLWTESQSNDTVRRGTLSVILGSVTPLNLAFNRTYYLQVRVTSGPPGPTYPLIFSPRTVLTSAPYAIRSDTAEYAKSSPGMGGGSFLPLAGGTMTGPIGSTGDPPITMGIGNFGTGNQNPGTFASVAGSNNRARGAYSTVGGGGGPTDADSNSARADYASVLGGRQNDARGNESTIGGGSANVASLDGATVAGGIGNVAIGDVASIGGGGANMAIGDWATIAGGIQNSVSRQYSTIGGGYHNLVSGEWSVIAGGADNYVSGYLASVGGGSQDSATNYYATVPGGLYNLAAGQNSLAAGRQAKALHDRAFVWSDGNNDADFGSTGTNQFLVHAAGGVGIDTNNPGAAALAVNGATQLGSGAPLVKMLKLTGTTANSDGGTVSIAHGLDQTKILSIEVMVDWGSNGSYIPPRYPVSGYEFYWGSGGSNINITNVSGNSASITSKPIKILIVYEQ